MHLSTIAVQVVAALAVTLSIFQVWMFRSFEVAMAMEGASTKESKFLTKWKSDNERKSIYSNIEVLPFLLLIGVTVLNINTLTLLFAVGIAAASVNHIVHVTKNYYDDMMDISKDRKG